MWWYSVPLAGDVPILHGMYRMSYVHGVLGYCVSLYLLDLFISLRQRHQLRLRHFRRLGRLDTFCRLRWRRGGRT